MLNGGFKFRAGKKPSIVWRFFEVDKQDTCKTVCKLCGKRMSRGTLLGNFTTSNMISHLKGAHLRHFWEATPRDCAGDMQVFFFAGGLFFFSSM